ncbi:MAG: hypothetical protein DRJ35_04395 [Thermoprotei archaeon]|nr:MAG: hypothetical protein DRJ35_04395 [Thermoprotei archaeon]
MGKMKMARYAISVKISTEEELERIEEVLYRLDDTDYWVELDLEKAEIIENASVSDIIDPFFESSVRIAAIKTPILEEEDYLEKLAVIGSEIEGNHIIFTIDNLPKEEIFLTLFDIFSIYKTKVSFDAHPAHLDDIYSDVSQFIGGIFGLSFTQEHYENTEEFIRFIRKYLGIVRNIRIINMDEENQPKPLLKPGKYNNPKLLKYLAENGYDGFLTLCSYNLYKEEISKEYKTLKEYVRSLEEKRPTLFR